MTISLVGRQRRLSVLFAMMAALCCAPTALAATGPRPCDLLASGTPCVAAISTTRALFQGYTGPLYEVTRQADKATRRISPDRDGYADAKAQDSFCAGASCTITRIYDQTANHNDLTLAPPGGASKGPGPRGYDVAAAANALPAMLDGHKVYGVAISPGMGYRNDTTRAIPAHGQPEGVYMVTSALHLNGKCCFDFGNAETNNLDNDKGHMDAINIMCRGKGACQPDAGLDMENGIYGHLVVPQDTRFVTDMGGCDGKHTFAIYQGDAEGRKGSGKLTTTGSLPLPQGYQPMQQEGAIILGIGGDNSNWAEGYFFEGVMTQGEPDMRAMSAVQSNIVGAHYAGQLQP